MPLWPAPVIGVATSSRDCFLCRRRTRHNTSTTTTTHTAPIAPRRIAYNALLGSVGAPVAGAAASLWALEDARMSAVVSATCTVVAPLGIWDTDDECGTASLKFVAIVVAAVLPATVVIWLLLGVEVPTAAVVVVVGDATQLFGVKMDICK